ncbi:transcriptional repressor general negative regulator of transcription subunit 4 [Lambiella insularis]|nr:transcriptional repressor general negative regulator of transcription subunit 4 [Lambiella insularis]
MAASRFQQDTFMDESDDACPLCVEEFDLSDKNFRPCPCGYQVCQFCYNNIKTNMNGLCPACRRPYDEKSIEWKIVSPEEFKADIALQARKKAAARQKEVERRQAESSSRKNLAGLRVVQKNLVYVVGLNPKIREEDLLQTLRGDQYFGQYGKIIKIVVSKAKEGSSGNQSIGVYVTFARKQDAASCIAAVDGSQNGDRTLRQSAIRDDKILLCTGEDNDSFSRQDLSSMNAVSTQRPAPSTLSSTKSTQQQPPPQPQPPSQQPLPTLSTASQSMARYGSKDGTMSRSDSGDGSALPTTANWVKNPQIHQSRRSSQGANRSTPSPRTSTANLQSALSESQPAPESSVPVTAEVNTDSPDQQSSSDAGASEEPSGEMPLSLIGLEQAVKIVTNSTFRWTLDRKMYDDETLRIIDNFPPLIDANGGAVRYAMKVQQERERLKEDEEQRNMLQAMASVDDDDNLASGSLQLGGEPETQDHQSDVLGRLSGQRGLQQRGLGASGGIGQAFDGQICMSNNFGDSSLSGRSMTPQHSQQISLLKSGNPQHEAILEQLQRGTSNNTNQHQPQLSNPFQAQNQQLSALSGHARQASRYTFANDSASASAAVKPATSAQLIAQQSAIMPPPMPKSFTSQPPQPHNLHTNFYSGVQGPPPGLKSSGTPPISGGGMFGQGHGFASAMGGSLGLGGSNLGGKNSNDDLMRDFLRGRSGISNGLGTEVGKREFMFPSFLQKPANSTTSPAPGLSSSLYGSQLGAYNGFQDQGHLRQKKKGKKHRHANTSSVGGGGIVDLADPSILQARVHHGATGQGQYGATQGQGPRDADTAEFEGTANVALNAAKVLPTSPSMSGTPVRTNTVTSKSAAPGFSLPEDFPPLATPHKIAAPSTKSTGSAISPVTPIKPVLTTLSTRPGTFAQDSKPLQEPPGKTNLNDAVNEQKTTETSSLIHAQARSQPSKDRAPVPQSSLGADKVSFVGRAAPVEVHNKGENIGSDKPPSTPEKRQRPGRLDIAAAKDVSKRYLELTISPYDQPVLSTPNKASRNMVIDVSQPNTPVTAASQSSASPAPRQQPPRTIRVVQTPRGETHKFESPVRAPASAVVVTPLTSVPHQLSRQPSISSVYQPDTPANETISDTVSLTSTSMSRPGSPPIGKVGSAPIRLNTKSQQKKDRQARARRVEESRQSEESATNAALPDEQVQAPIVGRKKKTRKSKLQSSADPATVESEPPSPLRHDEKVQGEPPLIPTIVPKEGKKIASAGGKATRESNNKVTSQQMFETTAGNPGDISEKSRKNQITAATIFAELQKAGEIVSNALDLFRNVPGINHRFDLTESDLTEVAKTPPLSEAQRRHLEQGTGIYVKTAGNKYAVILPNKRVLRGFSREQAERFLDLRQQTLDTTGPAMFRSSRHGIDRWMNMEVPGGVGSKAGSTEGHTTRLGEQHIMSNDVASVMADLFSMPSSHEKQANHPHEAFLDVNNTVQASASAVVTTRQATMSVTEAEIALAAARKETEALEKRLNGLLKKNRKLLMSSH